MATAVPMDHNHIDIFATARSAFASTPQTGYYSFTFTGDGCGGLCPTSGCYQEDMDCDYCLASWHSFPPDGSYKYDPIVSGGCSGTKVACPECEGMLGLSRYDLPSDLVEQKHIDTFAAARSALASKMNARPVEVDSQTGYYSFTFTGDGCGGQCPTSGCYQEDMDCDYCLASWHSFPPDGSYKYDPIVSGGCSGTKVACPECEGMLGLSRYDLPSDTFAAARSALFSTMKARPVEATHSQTGYYSFTFTGDGCGGQCPTSGCYEEDMDCDYCLASWHSFPPDGSYKYDPIVSGGCSGTKVDCPECEGMLGLSRYDLPSNTMVV